jgi:hypothetical protein
MHAKIILVFVSLLTFALFAGMIQNQVVSAQDSGEEKPETLEDQCAKTQENDLDALLCEAVLELQIKVADLEAETGVQEVEEEAAEEEIGEEIAEEDVMDETPAEEQVGSPLAQMMSGVNPDEIQCDSWHVLVFKASNSHPACVNESSFSVLISRGWLASYDPTLDLVTEEQTDDGTETVTEETQGKNYTADLSEEINMGAN